MRTFRRRCVSYRVGGMSRVRARGRVRVINGMWCAVHARAHANVDADRYGRVASERRATSTMRHIIMSGEWCGVCAALICPLANGPLVWLYLACATRFAIATRSVIIIILIIYSLDSFHNSARGVQTKDIT